MKIKLVDASLIADRALEIYASRYLKFSSTNTTVEKEFPSAVKSTYNKIFNEIIEEIFINYSSEYDYIIICIGCFPIMRIKEGVSLMTRYICKQSSFLREHCINVAQFLNIFEKFIQSICKTEKTQYQNSNIMFIKEKYTFYKDWVNLFNEYFGSSIIDEVELPLFVSNPRYIVKMEEPESMFIDFPLDIKYKDMNIIKSLIN